MTFEQIFQEYYTLFRGRATSFPVYGDREYAVAIQFANNAIRKWERADGQLWRELIDTAQKQTTAVWATNQRTIIGGQLDYTAPSNMRKPPAFIWLFDGSSQVRIECIEPQDVQHHPELSAVCFFSGSAQTGYTLHIGQVLSEQYENCGIDFVYYKKATLFNVATSPAAQIPELSDPNFIIQDMLASRYTNTRNGFGLNVSKKEASLSLANMKIENNSGVYSNAEILKSIGSGWGTTLSSDGIRL